MPDGNHETTTGPVVPAELLDRIRQAQAVALALIPLLEPVVAIYDEVIAEAVIPGVFPTTVEGDRAFEQFLDDSGALALGNALDRIADMAMAHV